MRKSLNVHKAPAALEHTFIRPSFSHPSLNRLPDVSGEVPPQCRVLDVHVGSKNPPRKQYIVDVLDIAVELLLRGFYLAVAVKVALLVRFRLSLFSIEKQITTDNHIGTAEVIALNRMNATNFASNSGVLCAETNSVLVSTVPS